VGQIAGGQTVLLLGLYSSSQSSYLLLSSWSWSVCVLLAIHSLMSTVSGDDGGSGQNGKHFHSGDNQPRNAAHVKLVSQIPYFSPDFN
jgi:hypothetical protein